MAEFTPINLFPNFIFVPKIVPLVYDDALSYYEFLNKVLVKLNEMIGNVNDLGLDVEELKTAVEQLSTLIDGFDGRIETLETNVEAINRSVDNLNNAMSRAYSDIEDLKAADTSIEARLTAIEAQITTDIAAAVAALQTEIGAVSSDVTAMESQLTALGGRVEALESATFESPIESNFNMFVGDMVNLSSLDYSIEEVTNNSQTTNNIRVNSDLIRFYHSSSNNEMALVIHNVLPYYGGNPYNGKVFSFANRYKTSGSSNGIDYCINVPFSSLTGSTPYIANSGYSSTRATMRILQLKRSTIDNNFYDLWIYNRYQGQYGILTGADVDFLNLVMVMRELDATQSADTIKAYFISELNSMGKRISRVVDKKTSDIYTYIDRQDNAIKSYCEEQIDNAESNLTKNCLPVRNNNDTWFETNGQDPNFIIDDHSFKTKTVYVHDYYNGTETDIDIALVYFNGSVEIESAAGVNLGAGWLDLGEVKIQRDGFSDYLIPEEEVEILAMPRLNINFLPARCEMILTKARHLRLRVEFDDTNFDWSNNSLIVKYAGVAALRWVAGYYPPA